VSKTYLKNPTFLIPILFNAFYIVWTVIRIAMRGFYSGTHMNQDLIFFGIAWVILFFYKERAYKFFFYTFLIPLFVILFLGDKFGDLILGTNFSTLYFPFVALYFYTVTQKYIPTNLFIIILAFAILIIVQAFHSKVYAGYHAAFGYFIIAMIIPFVTSYLFQQRQKKV